MHGVIKMLEQEIQVKQKFLHHKELLKGDKKLPVILRLNTASLSAAVTCGFCTAIFQLAHIENLPIFLFQVTAALNTEVFLGLYLVSAFFT